MSDDTTSNFVEDVPPLVVKYKNWRGETYVRRLHPIKVWYGKTTHHPEHQWFLTAYDHDKDGMRDFALKDFLGSEDFNA